MSVPLTDRPVPGQNSSATPGSMNSSVPRSTVALEQTPHGLCWRSRVLRPAQPVGSQFTTRCSSTSKLVVLVMGGPPRYVASTWNAVPVRSIVQLLNARALWFDKGTGLESMVLYADLPSG